MTDMSVFTGSTWRVGYGEISERLQFRIGLIGNAAWQAVFPIVQLTDLIGILQGTASSAVGQLIYGVQLQGKRVSDGFREQISIEPRSDQFPPAITLIQSADRADLLSVLQQLQAALPAAPADDWDNSKPRRLGYDELPSALSPDSLAAVYVPAFANTLVSYDSAGNVASVTDAGVTTTYTYNSDGTVATDTRGGKTRAYTYDAAGNLTKIEAS